MPIKWPQTYQQKLEVAEWKAGLGPYTALVHDAVQRNATTFGIALITRSQSDGYARN